MLSLSPMHAREIIELAGMVAAHSKTLTEGVRPIPPECIEQYWTHSKVRLDRWSRAMKGDDVFSRLVRGTIEEIVAGDVLARVWNAILAAYDRRRGSDEAGPVARSVMLANAEARNRAMILLLRMSKRDPRAAAELNRLRRHADRWTGLLLEEIESPERFFAQHPAGRPAIEQKTPFSAAGPNPELNARIAAAIVGCFPDESFGRAGLRLSSWFIRAMRTADDAQAMIDGLLDGEISKRALNKNSPLPLLGRGAGGEGD